MTANTDTDDAPRGLSGKLDTLRQMVSTILTEDSEEARAKRTGATALAIRVAAAGIAYASHVLMARFLGSFEYGIFAYIWVWATILGPTSTLGFSHSVYRFVPQYGETGDDALARGFIFGGGIFVALTALSIAVIGSLGVYFFRESIQTYYVMPFVIGMALVAFFAVQDFIEGIARAYSWIATAVAPPFILRQSLIVFGVGLVILTGGPADAISAIVVAIISSAISMIVHILLVRHRLKSVLKPGPRSFDYWVWIKTSIPILSVDLSHVLFAYADIIVLSFYWPPDVIAVYFAATRILQLVHFVRYAATAATAQRFSANSASGNHDKLKSLAQVAVRWTFWASLAGASFVVVTGPQLLGMFGADFGVGYSALVLLAAGVVIQSVAAPGEDLLNMTGHERVSAVISIASVALNFALNLAFVPTYGVMGAASATVLAMAIRTLMLGIAARKQLGIEVFVWNVRKDS